jgi:hypothetical protein
MGLIEISRCVVARPVVRTQVGNQCRGVILPTLSIYLRLYSPLVDLGSYFSFLIFFYTVGRTVWTADQPVARPLPTQDNTNTE